MLTYVYMWYLYYTGTNRAFISSKDEQNAHRSTDFHFLIFYHSDQSSCKVVESIGCGFRGVPAKQRDLAIAQRNSRVIKSTNCQEVVCHVVVEALSLLVAPIAAFLPNRGITRERYETAESSSCHCCVVKESSLLNSCLLWPSCEQLDHKSNSAMSILIC